jgi:hypothetical protein
MIIPTDKKVSIARTHASLELWTLQLLLPFCQAIIYNWHKIGKHNYPQHFKGHIFWHQTLQRLNHLVRISKLWNWFQHPVYKTENTAVGIYCTDQVTPSISKVRTNFADKLRPSGRYSLLTDCGHGVCFWLMLELKQRVGSLFLTHLHIVDLTWTPAQVQVPVILRPMVSRPVCLGVGL